MRAVTSQNHIFSKIIQFVCIANYQFILIDNGENGNKGEWWCFGKCIMGWAMKKESLRILHADDNDSFKVKFPHALGIVAKLLF